MKHLKGINGFKSIKIVTKVSVEQPEEDPGDKILMDLLDIVQSIGHEDIPFTLDWSDEDENKLYKDYLVRVYGPDIRKYEEFILECC